MDVVYKVRITTRNNKEIDRKYFYKLVDVKKFVLNLNGYRTIEKVRFDNLTEKEIKLLI